MGHSVYTICYIDFGDKSTKWTHPLHTKNCMDARLQKVSTPGYTSSYKHWV